jgi:hypothetical protein
MTMEQDEPATRNSSSGAWDPPVPFKLSQVLVGHEQDVGGGHGVLGPMGRAHADPCIPLTHTHTRSQVKDIACLGSGLIVSAARDSKVLCFEPGRPEGTGTAAFHVTGEYAGHGGFVNALCLLPPSPAHPEGMGLFFCLLLRVPLLLLLLFGRFSFTCIPLTHFPTRPSASLPHLAHASTRAHTPSPPRQDSWQVRGGTRPSTCTRPGSL